MTHAHLNGAVPRGFSLLELLVAMTICAIVAAIVGLVVPPARAAFERTPAAIELQQRERMAIDAIAQAIRAAGGDAVAASEFGPLSGFVPAVIPHGVSDGQFTTLTVIGPRVQAGQGVLDQHQAGVSGPLSFGSTRCPAVSVVCGFTRGTTALIADGSGRFEVFTVESADVATHRITAARSLIAPYPAGSVVIEVDVDTFQLDAQPDGSRTLVRVSAAGAVQPIADRVSDLAFELYAPDSFGALMPVAVNSLTDGPWLPGEPEGLYDEDVLRIRRVDIRLIVNAAPPAATQRMVRFGVVLRNAP